MARRETLKEMEERLMIENQKEDGSIPEEVLVQVLAIKQERLRKMEKLAKVLRFAEVIRNIGVIFLLFFIFLPVSWLTEIYIKIAMGLIFLSITLVRVTIYRNARI